MSSVPTAVVDALIAQLAAAPAFEGWGIDRGRISAVTLEEMPRLVVSASSARIEDVWTGRRDVTMEITVEAFRAAADGEGEAELDAALFDLGAAIVTAIEADLTLGGIADDAEPGTVEVQTEMGSPPVGTAAVTLTVLTGVVPGDMTARA